MRIEIFGLPGVGKTHILGTLIKRHPEMRKYILKYRLASSWSERRRDFGYFVRRPRLLLSSALEADRAELILRFRRVARRRAHAAMHDNCILDDSGTIQPLVEAYILSDGPALRSDWEGLFRDAIMGHCYFYITDSIENTVRREMSRPDRRFLMGEEDLSLKYRGCKRILDRIKKELDVQEFMVSDYESTEALADEMQRVMSGLLRGGA